jgi:hypothetical protein
MNDFMCATNNVYDLPFLFATMNYDKALRTRVSSQNVVSTKCMLMETAHWIDKKFPE